VVRWEGDTLYLLGRLGTRIRKSAQWVHPAEVERVLLGVPGVLTAAVVGATRDGSEQVVAFLEVEPEFEPRKLSSHLRGELARFKWPDWFQPVASLPIRGMGKVDRQRLVEMAGAGPTQGAFNRAGRPV
jgi:acyl-CoA synthetase (AMP-forming)/AMP-acid ligase II